MCFTFTLELANLPNSIKCIKFTNKNYNKELNNLPNSIKYLILPKNYNLEIKKLPSNLKLVECDKDYEFIDIFEKTNIKIRFL